MQHTENTGLINFTDSAALRVKSLLEEETKDMKLRVYITGGGCSGFQYGFSFDEHTSEDDTRIDNQGVSLLIDPMSFQYLAGSEIDYCVGLQGARFIINNPNAVTTCGCGASFSI